MIRISTIFIAICMVLIAASLGLVLYSMAGLNGAESAIVALTALTFLILYSAVSMRLRDRSDVGGQIADLSRGTGDLARQVAEFGRRLAAVESRLVSADASGQDRIHTVLGEINELGALVKELAVSVAAHDEFITSVGGSGAAPAGDITDGAADAATTMQDPGGLERVTTRKPFAGTAAAKPAALAERPAPDNPDAARQTQLVHAVRNAVDTSSIDIYLQPMVTLPQRKVRFYEAVSRIRDDNDQVIAAADFIVAAEAAGLMGRIDHMVMFRCIQVLRRLMVRNKDVGVFCNISAATLGDREVFAQCLDFLEANRALAPFFVLEFRHSTFRSLGPVESEHLAALVQRGFKFSIDNLIDLRIEPRDLADRGVRFIKVPAAMLLDQKQLSAADIHPADLSDLLGRFGIDLIAERIEGERSVVDLLDYDVRFGQGFLFAPPRPLRSEAVTAADKAAENPKDGGQGSVTMAASRPDPAKSDPPRATGNAALARRAAGPN